MVESRSSFLIQSAYIFFLIMVHEGSLPENNIAFNDISIYPSNSLSLRSPLFFDVDVENPIAVEDPIAVRPLDDPYHNYLSPLAASPSQLPGATPFSDDHTATATKPDGTIPTIPSPGNSDIDFPQFAKPNHSVSFNNDSNPKPTTSLCNGLCPTSIAQQLPSNIHTLLYLDTTPCSDYVGETSHYITHTNNSFPYQHPSQPPCEPNISPAIEPPRSEARENPNSHRDVNDLLKLGTPIQLPCSSAFQTMSPKEEQELLGIDDLPQPTAANAPPSSIQYQKHNETLRMIEDLLSLSSKQLPLPQSASTSDKTEVFFDIDDMPLPNHTEFCDILPNDDNFDNLSLLLPTTPETTTLGPNYDDLSTIPLEIESILRTVPQDIILPIMPPRNNNQQYMKRKASCLTASEPEQTEEITKAPKKARTTANRTNKQTEIQPQHRSPLSPGKKPVRKRINRGKKRGKAGQTSLTSIQDEEIQSQPEHPPSPQQELPEQEYPQQEHPQQEHTQQEHTQQEHPQHVVGTPPSSTPSRFCHICTRSAKPNNMLVCSNVTKGTCRKIICFRCVRDVRWDWGALKEDESWICTHCRNVWHHFSHLFQMV